MLLIVPASSALGELEGGNVVEDQPVSRVVENEGGNYYESEWVVSYENDNGSYTDTMWSEDKPTENTAFSETDADSSTDTITDISVNREDSTVYPVAPWMASLLQLIVPLVLIAGALVSFSKIARATDIRSLKNHYLVNWSEAKARGQINFGSLISLVIGVLFATVLLVKMTPIIQDYATNIGGLYGFGWLISFIPVVLVIAVFMKIANDM